METKVVYIGSSPRRHHRASPHSEQYIFVSLKTLWFFWLEVISLRFGLESEEDEESEEEESECHENVFVLLRWNLTWARGTSGFKGKISGMVMY
jgi:hypothetical protein